MNRATTIATQEFAKRSNCGPGSFHTLGRTGLTTSVVGFGCYRIDDEVPIYTESLKLALQSGCNLIDTSTNYTDGGSERCVGNTLKELFQSQQIRREEIIVVSKVGYAQGENLDLLQQAERNKKPYSDVVKYMDGCWHCIHPDFISHNLTRSLERTQLEHIDVYLLHNPEYFFSDALHRNPNANLEDLRNIFYERIRGAFIQLEKEVEGGRISHYGVSSNSFGRNTDDGEMTSVSKMWEIANRITPNHHFSVIQLPANLFENGPMLEANNESLTALVYAEKMGLGVLVNRPLNAIIQNQLLRLSDQGIPAAAESDLVKSINRTLPKNLWNESLSRKSLAIIGNTRGVSCVLNGMRKPEYVTDSMGVMHFPHFEVIPHFFESFYQ